MRRRMEIDRTFGINRRREGGVLAWAVVGLLVVIVLALIL